MESAGEKMLWCKLPQKPQNAAEKFALQLIIKRRITILDFRITILDFRITIFNLRITILKSRLSTFDTQPTIVEQKMLSSPSF